jgi:hypothetical protein
MDEDIVATLGPVLSGRIYPSVAPARVVQPANGATPAPYGIYQRVSGGEITYIDGARDTVVNARYQVDTFGREKAALNTIAADIKEAMNEATLFKSICLDERDDFEDAVQMYRVSMDFSIWKDTGS